MCLLPFARTAATRFISPTKTLEYMAAHKPIISTPIADVVESYGAVVRLATGAAEFVAALDAALNESPQARAARLATERRLLARSTWDAIATAMDECMARAEEAKEPAPQVRLLRPVAGARETARTSAAVATAATATSR